MRKKGETQQKLAQVYNDKKSLLLNVKCAIAFHHIPEPGSSENSYLLENDGKATTESISSILSHFFSSNPQINVSYICSSFAISPFFTIQFDHQIGHNQAILGIKNTEKLLGFKLQSKMADLTSLVICFSFCFF